MDAVEGEVEDLARVAIKRVFSETRGTPTIRVCPREESNEQRLDRMVLSDDAFVEFGINLSVDGMEFLDLSRSFFGIERGRG